MDRFDMRRISTKQYRFPFVLVGAFLSTLILAGLACRGSSGSEGGALSLGAGGYYYSLPLGREIHSRG